MSDATDQASEYLSIFAPRELKLDDGTVIQVPPHPNLRMLDDDALDALDELHLMLEEEFDREDDIYIPEQKVKDRNGNDMVLPAETKRGPLKTNPYRKTDPKTGKVEKLQPSYQVQVAMIALGEEQYAKLRAGKINGRKGSQADVWRVWNEQGSDLVRRQQTDSKSDGSVGDLAEVPPPDSQ